MICFRQISSNKIVESSIWFHPNLLPQDRQLSMIWLCPSLGSPGSSKSLWSLPCDPHCSIIMRSITLGNLLPPNFVCNSVRDPRFTIFFSSRMFRHGLSSSSIYIQLNKVKRDIGQSQPYGSQATYRSNPNIRLKSSICTVSNCEYITM